MKSDAQEIQDQVNKTDTISSGLKKNVIYGTFGTIAIWATMNVNYERMLTMRE